MKRRFEGLAVLRIGLYLLTVNALLGWSDGLVILAPEDLQGTVFNAPRLSWIGPVDWSFDVIGILVTYHNESTEVENKIVLLNRYFNNEVADIASRHALGALIYGDGSPADIPGVVDYILDEPQFGLMLPSVAVSIITVETLQAWLDEGRTITVRITSEDVNEWTLMMESGAMIFYSVFMSAFTLTCIGLAAYKLAMFVKAKGCQESIPQTMLIFEIVANTIRFFPSVVDPLQSRALLPYAVSQMFFTTSWPFVIINLLLISFYWHELIEKTTTKINSFLDKLRIPFWCIFAVILALEVTASILRGTDFNFQVFLIVMGICYIIIGLACAIFYVVTGVRLTKALRTMSKEVVVSSRSRRLNRTSQLIYASTGGVILWLVAVALGGLTDLFWLPWGYYGVWFVGYFAITFISLMQILALHEPGSICGSEIIFENGCSKLSGSDYIEEHHSYHSS